MTEKTTKPCKYCGKEVGADTNFCWFCGRELYARPERPEVTPSPSRWSWLGWALLAVLLIALLLVFLTR